MTAPATATVTGTFPSGVSANPMFIPNCPVSFGSASELLPSSPMTAKVAGGTLTALDGTPLTLPLTSAGSPIGPTGFWYWTVKGLPGVPEFSFFLTADADITSLIQSGLPSGTGSGAVDSVNGKTGVVVLSASDVAALSLPSGTAAAGEVPVATGSGNQAQWGTASLIGLAPSGDTTGATDTANIQGLLNLGALAVLQPGTFYVQPVNAATGSRLIGKGSSTILKWASGVNDNMLKCESVSDVHISDLVLDGNKANQANVSYGLYFGTCQDCSATRVRAQNWNGDGIQIYDSDRVSLESCWSTGNNYHGFEVEQCRDCSVTDCSGYSNTLHGLLITPGEVGGTGSIGNHITGGAFNSNGNYGICVNSDNAGAGSQLSEGNIFTGCSVRANANYGVCCYQQSKNQFNGLFIRDNGFHGIYCYESAHNVWTNIYLRNNGTAANDAYDQIMVEGAASGYASGGSIFTAVKTIIDSSPNKAANHIVEGASGDANIWIGVDRAGTSGASGNYVIQSGSTQVAVT
jgi:hypothetical protein